ncbi:sodium-coupled monocarboxylate transporter 2-like [Neocloeon triangulifer]|uniref:sodium-coupled monocarboxylate transporter 2-like n=1 Tax=Neocloeon triangulifer TaxID=2078957 RepID=UPI00286F46D3|nr:sodium-coupled monocarboxylate transporter 2-like [Neocloeon triangulifer]
MDPLEQSTKLGFTPKAMSILDYSIFCTLMLFSTLIGVYFAFFAKQKQNTTAEYLMGGKNMAIFPITMSLIASYISGVSMLGVPAEIYTYGTQYAAVLISEALVCFVTAYVFMPVFYKLQLYSSFEYLLLRYDSSVRLLLSVLYCIMTISYTPLIIYIPALAFSQVSGANLHIVAPITCAICIFYTSLGGLRAVVWTDTLQSFSMISGILVVTILGTLDVGGFGVVMERAANSDRLEFFNLDPDPLVRHTFWTVTIGNFFMWLAHLAANQAILQRCLALPTIEKAKRALISLAVGTVIFVIFSVYSGLVIYAKYHECDPVHTQAIRKVDQILPFTVMDFSNTIPGFPGLFIAGVFSAALSSMSTNLNSLSGVILQDFIKPCLRGRQMSEKAASTTMKVIVVVVGTFCTALVFVVDKLGAIIQLSRTISGVTAGAMLGIFVLGMTVPWINAKGALIGGISSLFVAGWVAFGSQQAIASGSLRFQTKPMSVEGCSYAFPPTNSTINGQAIEEAFWVFRISYLYLTVIGFVTMVLIATLVTLITGPNDPRKVHRDLLSPLVHRFLPLADKDDEPVAETLLVNETEYIKALASEGPAK